MSLTTEAWAYVGMFWSAFLSATVLPGASEVTFVALAVSGEVVPSALVAVATVGNTLGSVANWACGRFLLRFVDRRWFPVGQTQVDRAKCVFDRFGTWTLLLAWLPVVGDALTVAAGMLRVRMSVFVPLVGIGKLGRYLFLLGASSLVAAG